MVMIKLAFSESNIAICWFVKVAALSRRMCVNLYGGREEDTKQMSTKQPTGLVLFKKRMLIDAECCIL